MLPILAVVTFLAAYLLYHWLIVVTEGAFFGRRFVVWLYDLTAPRYEGIKQYQLEDEEILLIEPLLGELEGVSAPVLVDVATGTGRVPFFLGQDGRFFKQKQGRIIAIEPAERMLGIAQTQLHTFTEQERRNVLLVQQYAECLPLPTAVADAVTCLEALEFFANPDQAVRELVRILRPGGVLFLTRRHGREAYLFLHRYRSHAALSRQLTTLGMTDINEIAWEMDYNLLIARKAHTR